MRLREFGRGDHLRYFAGYSQPRSGQVNDELLIAVEGANSKPVCRASLADLHLQERAHLQEWVLANPSVLGRGIEIVTSEYDRWQTAAGDPVKDRLDILGIDPDGRLVVVELKRDAAPRAVHMQAVNYAAMVSRLSPSDVAELWSAYRFKRGDPVDVASARVELETEKALTEASIRRPRIVLVASDFPVSVTAAVVWLNEQGVDISLIRYRAYRLGDESVVVSFAQLFPVPDVEDFTIGRRTEVREADVEDLGEPWDEPSLRRLAEQANEATLALLDLCSAEGAPDVLFADVVARAGIASAQARSQLAGLTKRLRDPAYAFAQHKWPVEFSRLPTGAISFRMDQGLAAAWRKIRAQS